MNKSKLIGIAFAMMSIASPATAGGLLTNTNQNVHFLRNPARDATIGIDGVYSNPAGVIFLGEGFHFSINLQNAHQTRTITTGFPLFVNNANQPGQSVHQFKGTADAPIIPSLLAAYNLGKWSFQFSFAITGGGGKCEFDNGLGSFEQVVSAIPYTPVPVGGNTSSAMDLMNKLYAGLGQVNPALASHKMGNKYGYDSFMRGRQYYYGFTFGAAHKLTDNLSVYGGLRMLYGSANYFGYVKNIQVEHIDGDKSEMVAASQHFNEQAATFNQAAGVMEQKGVDAEQMAVGAEQMAVEMEQKGDLDKAADYRNAAAGYRNAAAKCLQAAGQLKQGATLSTALAAGTQDIELNCDQTGWGVAPIIGVDYKTGKLNLAAKYEFKTRMRLKNKSANSLSAENIAMLDKFKDGKSVPEDSPALLTIGAQYQLLPALRVMAGWHHYFDVDTKQYTKDMLSDTNEYLFGAEYDINSRLLVSAGAQLTRYGFKDAGMNDISFNVNSTSYGFGVGYQVSDKVKVNLAYFQTLYGDYDKKETIGGMETTNSFTRTNRVIGVGVDFKI